ncbi:hypothetical protein SELR_pSRC100020 (plasmid) [Selenomonas ruminantium subsp. lactilytica TAM6421]|uniref:ParB-like N-terminal domain-containing protein n=1 Tax=Selenomonas ruminantium subsp. lactilytica (strain NBRC 103574 / TAM6421) TaxID=927704 RepID=I0GVM2_SELRL|nr:ParB N-terminal domain-containing protein [Selenomonas ruminantium]BAL84809.1 hypothetical protein SELR_pSRC100020 [Selenomonas ruminantium subsp. lactilytica TAM6421]
MSSNKNNSMMGISFVDLSGKNEDTSSMPVGVSNRFENEEFREMTRRRLMGQNSAPAETKAEAPAETEAAIQETTAKTDKILTEIAGSTGTYQLLSLDALVPTPDEWNQFSSISNEKKVLMADSIYRNGLQQPLVVRALDPEGRQYQILAGNTRKSIYEVLYDLTGEEKYLSIECKVYAYQELTDDQAREIASDTNYVQRANLTGRDKSFAVRTKLNILKKRGEKQILEKAAEQMGMKRTAAFSWNKMANLIPAFFDLFDEGRISQKTATRIAAWNHDVQEELYMRSEQITEDVIMAIPAKTPSELVLGRFQELTAASQQEQAEVRQIGHIESLEEQENGYTIHLSGKAPEASQLVIMYLPNKKAKAFRNKYQDFIIEAPETETP